MVERGGKSNQQVSRGSRFDSSLDLTTCNFPTPVIAFCRGFRGGITCETQPNVGCVRFMERPLTLELLRKWDNNEKCPSLVAKVLSHSKTEVGWNLAVRVGFNSAHVCATARGLNFVRKPKAT